MRPDGMHQRIGRDDLLWMENQKREQVEGFGADLHDMAVAPERAVRKVNFEVVESVLALLLERHSGVERQRQRLIPAALARLHKPGNHYGNRQSAARQRSWRQYGLQSGLNRAKRPSTEAGVL